MDFPVVQQQTIFYRPTVGFALNITQARAIVYAEGYAMMN
jgi:hypothetical protein